MEQAARQQPGAPGFAPVDLAGLISTNLHFVHKRQGGCETMKYWKRSKLYRCALVLGVSAAVNSFHSAQTLAGDACRVVFAHGAAVSSLDPHYNVVTPNHAISEHIFSTLVLQDENLRIQPGLAKSWEVSSEDNKVWTFHLRDDVKWHDGEKFTADDVLFTFNRVPTVENSPSSYSIYTQPVAKIEVLDEHTIRFTTHDVFTLLPQYVARLAIIPRHAAEGKKSSDYDQGVATIGTGPYKYKEYTPGEKIVLTRNEDYWGNIPQVKEVEFRFISNNATRGGCVAFRRRRHHRLGSHDGRSGAQVAQRCPRGVDGWCQEHLPVSRSGRGTDPVCFRQRRASLSKRTL
jgi:MarR-like DNA-binding transcriptional regulator SgrR of sgrS sRNA